MNASLNTILADLDAIGLDELNKRAAMLTRVDRKYALDVTQASAILSRLPAETKVLQIAGQVSQGYASTYYDTPDMDSYLLTGAQAPPPLQGPHPLLPLVRRVLPGGQDPRPARRDRQEAYARISWDEAGAPLAGEPPHVGGRQG